MDFQIKFLLGGTGLNEKGGAGHSKIRDMISLSVSHENTVFTRVVFPPVSPESYAPP